MAYNIISNRKNTSATIHFQGSNTSLVVAGNTAVSNVATNGEVLTGAYIAQAIWGTDAGYIQVLRGTTVVATYNNSGSHDYAAAGMPINVQQANTLVVNFAGSSNGFLLLELQKVGTGLTSNSYFQN